jgi:hypothetical protein
MGSPDLAEAVATGRPGEWRETSTQDAIGALVPVLRSEHPDLTFD